MITRLPISLHDFAHFLVLQRRSVTIFFQALANEIARYDKARPSTTQPTNPSPEPGLRSLKHNLDTGNREWNQNQVDPRKTSATSPENVGEGLENLSLDQQQGPNPRKRAPQTPIQGSGEVVQKRKMNKNEGRAAPLIQGPRLPPQQPSVTVSLSNLDRFFGFDPRYS